MPKKDNELKELKSELQHISYALGGKSGTEFFDNLKKVELFGKTLAEILVSVDLIAEKVATIESRLDKIESHINAGIDKKIKIYEPCLVGNLGTAPSKSSKNKENESRNGCYFRKNSFSSSKSWEEITDHFVDLNQQSENNHENTSTLDEIKRKSRKSIDNLLKY